jgi:NAD(P)-dependent dehydrogenase (short-subunit alcohol dehydrogenase family)
MQAFTNGEVGSLLAGRSALVAGGTGNVGRHIVAALLQRGATVVVPSRSASKLDALRAAVGASSGRLETLAGDVADERDAARTRDETARRVPSALDAVVASLGRWTSAPSILAATRADLVEVLEHYLVAHFVVARTFLPALVGRRGSYTFINGPSAFVTWPGSGLVSIATAAQAMLARALAAEAGVGEAVRITDLVVHPSAWIGPEPAADGGPIDGAAVGRYVAALVAGIAVDGPTVHLESPGQLAALP